MIPPINAAIENSRTAPAARSLLLLIPSFDSKVTVSHKASMELLIVSNASTTAMNSVINSHSIELNFSSAPKKNTSNPMVS